MREYFDALISSPPATGVSKEELVNGGLEVMLYDHHHFSGDHNIGGVRMCVPKRKDQLTPRVSPSPDNVCPIRCRSLSPVVTGMYEIRKE